MKKKSNFTIFPIHEAINRKAEQRKIQAQFFGKLTGLNPFYIFSDNRTKPDLENTHDWMNN